MVTQLVGFEGWYLNRKKFRAWLWSIIHELQAAFVLYHSAVCTGQVGSSINRYYARRRNTVGLGGGSFPLLFATIQLCRTLF